MYHLLYSYIYSNIFELSLAIIETIVHLYPYVLISVYICILTLDTTVYIIHV